ncbi:hypothetical protein M2152_000064 [Microbacteriaceae bacterium SG_E_30_P1]|uniref:Cadherin-like domain-containing protein n=1 Tax=Antiquaquibacter oligotrophicus TaxID=2880260 RepID=A0ABT6KL72_9MICO|nr:Ig-like domain-containing protein [Antiquaquibacter oligotrophicus]MDH6179882.1 hypothetical protein [Antiquaquibacter oligotrophicus]UDF14357.1 Ig-like domain-containing protein [Antiquaquibacter oligotrophicus]
MPAPLESPAHRFRLAAMTTRPLRFGAIILVIALTFGFSTWAVMPAIADDTTDPSIVVDEDSTSDLAETPLPVDEAPAEAEVLLPDDALPTAAEAVLPVDAVPSPVEEALPVNAVPVAYADFYETGYEEPLVATTSASGLFSNDTDGDGDDLTVVGFDPPGQGILNLDPTTGYFTYTPAAGFSGEIQFWYWVTDGTDESNPALVSITVAAAPKPNSAPVAVADSYVTGKNQLLVIPAPGVVVNDTDADGDPLKAAIVVPAGGALPGEQLILDPKNGTTFYTPPTDFTGTRTFTYRAWDGIDYSAPVALVFEITEELVDYAEPVAVDDEYWVVSGSTLSVPAPGLLGNDTDADSSFSLASYVFPDHGAITSMSPLTGAFEYVPSDGFVGDDTFTYVARDPQGGESGVATVTIHVLAEGAEPTSPVAADDAFTIAQGETLSMPALVGLLANDSDPEGDLLSVASYDNPSAGTVSVDPLGGFTYTPPVGFSGDATFDYRATDGNNLSDWATVTITVTPGEAEGEGGGAGEGEPQLPAQPADPDEPLKDGTTAGGEPSASNALASTGSATSGLAAFAAVFLVAIGGVAMRRSRARSRAR